MQNDSLTIALRYLKFRPRSEFEIRKKLKARFGEKEIDKVIVVLKKQKLLDDREFAKMWVRDRNLLKPEGAYLLKLELRKFGIKDSHIETAMNDQNEESLAKKALESKYRYRNADYEKKVAFLQRRGFSTGVIYKILKN